MANLETKIEISAVDKASPAIKAVGQSLERLKKSAANISASYNAMGSAAADFGRRMRNLTLVVAAAGAGIYGIVKSYADLGETLALTAQKTGVSVENLQKLGYVAELDKVSADGLRMSLQFLNKNMALARQNPKSEQAKMFKSLGIDVKKTTDAYEVFLKMSDKFQKNGNTAEKNLFARGLLGKAGVEMIPILNKGSAAIRELGEEYAKLGHVMSKETADAADNFGDNLQRLGVATKGLVAIFAEQLIPILNPLVTQFTEWVASNKELVKTNVKDFLIGAVDAFKAITSVMRTVHAALSPLVSAFGGLENVVKALAFVYVASLAMSFGKLIYSMGMFGASLLALTPGLFAGAAAMWAFVAPMLVAATPILAVVAAVALLAGAAYLIYENWGAFKTFWANLWAGIPDYAKTAMRIVAGVLTLGMSEIGIAMFENFEAIKAKISASIDWLVAKYNSVKSFFGMGDDKQTIDPNVKMSEAGKSVDSLAQNSQKAAMTTEELGSAFASAGAATIAAMNPVLGILMQVSGAVDKIKAALASMANSKINIGVTTSGVPSAAGGGAASPAGAAAATPAKTALLTPPANAQVASASPRTKLDVYMKIDAEGRPKGVTAKSSGNMDFAANTGRMV